LIEICSKFICEEKDLISKLEGLEEKEKILILQHSFNVLKKSHEKIKKKSEIEEETTNIIVSELEDHKILFSTALKLEKINPKVSFDLYNKASMNGSIKSKNNLGEKKIYFYFKSFIFFF
jgi:hypothetical protein